MSVNSSQTLSSPPEAAERKEKVDAEKRVQEVVSDDDFEVKLDDSDNPQKLPTLKRWLIVAIISLGSVCVTCASSAAAFTERGVAEEFHVPHIVTILSVSLFVEGLGLGPLLVGPLSQVLGRNPVYLASFALLFIFSWPVAFAPNITVYLVFRFITGFCGSAFLSVAGGSVSDLFDDASVGNPMTMYTASPFLGPVIGPLFSGFINQNASWRWTYRVLIVWVFLQLVALFVFVPETYAPVILKKKAARLRKRTGDDRYWAPLDRKDAHLARAILVSCYQPFQLMLFDRMALLLNTWTALILGILYLTFQAFPVIFIDKHGFNMQMCGLTFLGIGLGMILALPTQRYWNRRMMVEAKNSNGAIPPEARLIMGEAGGILISLSLFILAFTTYPNVHWIAPILASIPFGTGTYYVFVSVFTYLVIAYRPIAASAMASNSALRSLFAAVFPLFAGPMYDRLGTVGATALLAGLAALMAPLPFVFRRIGWRLRQKSRFAAH